jgi:uncharacterized protein
MDWINPHHTCNGDHDGVNATLTSPISPDGRPQRGAVYTVPARQGRAVRLSKGERLRIVNPHGTQVCDFWALCWPGLHEVLSMEHVRASLSRTIPRAGDVLVTSRRRPLLRLVEDTSPGVHDTLIAACDLPRYRSLGVDGYHDNCSDNLRLALRAIGIRPSDVPAPLNLWMNNPVSPQGDIGWEPPLARPGDAVLLEVLEDCIAVLSACPQDLVPVNGADCTPRDLQFEVLGPAA